ncbi:MAG: DUF72 domain-containing protein [Candidatus Euphemobacter frigidus]|nr:DUF72 domain-containing protein [Candidatus Euphemobacter frigidus]
MKKSVAINIGTSGWHYRHWKGPFYPRSLPSSDWLKYYAGHLSTTEINNTFYQLPGKKTLAGWKNIVPRDFVFSVKASRYITHMKKLKDPEKTLPAFLNRISALKETLGPILFQLPPHWRCNPGRLDSFLDSLPDGHSYTFEFRDPSWFDDRVYEILSRYKAAFCIYHLAGKISPRIVTADFIYVRLHGPGAAYQGQYSTKTLAGWAETFSGWREEGKSVYCYFDNDQNGYAPRDAHRLKNMLSSSGGNNKDN